MPQERRADAATAMLRQDKDVLEVESGCGAKCRIGLEKDGVPDRFWLLFPKRQPRLETRAGAKAIFQQALLFLGIRRRQLLKLRQRDDQID